MPNHLPHLLALAALLCIAAASAAEQMDRAGAPKPGLSRQLANGLGRAFRPVSSAATPKIDAVKRHAQLTPSTLGSAQGAQPGYVACDGGLSRSECPAASPVCCMTSLPGVANFTAACCPVGSSCSLSSGQCLIPAGRPAAASPAPARQVDAGTGDPVSASTRAAANATGNGDIESGLSGVAAASRRQLSSSSSRMSPGGDDENGIALGVTTGAVLCAGYMLLLAATIPFATLTGRRTHERLERRRARQEREAARHRIAAAQADDEADDEESAALLRLRDRGGWSASASASEVEGASTPVGPAEGFGVQQGPQIGGQTSLRVSLGFGASPPASALGLGSEADEAAAAAESRPRSVGASTRISRAASNLVTTAAAAVAAAVAPAPDSGDDDEAMCIICRERHIRGAILPCRHACCCRRCFAALRGVCPVCRGAIKSFVRFKAPIVELPPGARRQPRPKRRLLTSTATGRAGGQQSAISAPVLGPWSQPVADAAAVAAGALPPPPAVHRDDPLDIDDT